MAVKDVIVLNSHGVGQYAYTDHMPKWGETLSVKKWHVAEPVKIGDIQNSFQA